MSDSDTNYAIPPYGPNEQRCLTADLLNAELTAANTKDLPIGDRCVVAGLSYHKQCTFMGGPNPPFDFATEIHNDIGKLLSRIREKKPIGVASAKLLCEAVTKMSNYASYLTALNTDKPNDKGAPGRAWAVAVYKIACDRMKAMAKPFLSTPHDDPATVLQTYRAGLTFNDVLRGWPVTPTTTTTGYQPLTLGSDRPADDGVDWETIQADVLANSNLSSADLYDATWAALKPSAVAAATGPAPAPAAEITADPVQPTLAELAQATAAVTTPAKRDTTTTATTDGLLTTPRPDVISLVSNTTSPTQTSPDSVPPLLPDSATDSDNADTPAAAPAADKTPYYTEQHIQEQVDKFLPPRAQGQASPFHKGGVQIVTGCFQAANQVQADMATTRDTSIKQLTNTAATLQQTLTAHVQRTVHNAVGERVAQSTAAAGAVAHKLDLATTTINNKVGNYAKRTDHLFCRVTKTETDQKAFDTQLQALAARQQRAELLQQHQAAGFETLDRRIQALESELADSKANAAAADNRDCQIEVFYPPGYGPDGELDLQDAGADGDDGDNHTGDVIASPSNRPSLSSAKLPPLPTYKHGNVDNHFALLETYFRLTNTPAELHIDYALLSMPQVLNFWQMLADRDPERVTWLFFKDSVTTYLQGSRHTNQALSKLLRYKQNNQNVSAYAKYFLQLVNDSNTNPSEAWLVSHFVMGLSDPHLRRTLASNNGEMWQDVLQLVQHLTKVTAYEQPALHGNGLNNKHRHNTLQPQLAGTYRKWQRADSGHHRPHHTGGFKRDHKAAFGTGDANGTKRHQWGKPNHTKPGNAPAHNNGGNKFSNGAGGSRPAAAKLNTLQVSIDPLTAQLNTLALDTAVNHVRDVQEDGEIEPQYPRNRSGVATKYCLLCKQATHWTHKCSRVRRMLYEPCAICRDMPNHNHITHDCPPLDAQAMSFAKATMPGVQGLTTHMMLRM